MYYWPVLAGIGTAVFGVAGFVTENQKWAAMYAAILVLCWILVAVRLFAFNR
jgi:fucose permease